MNLTKDEGKKKLLSDEDRENVKEYKIKIDHKELYRYYHTKAEDVPESALPEQWDWRSINGEDFVSPVIPQGDCGSCYAVSGIHQYESRV
jgi:C1A family cysteine protease